MGRIGADIFILLLAVLAIVSWGIVVYLIVCGAIGIGIGVYYLVKVHKEKKSTEPAVYTLQPTSPEEELDEFLKSQRWHANRIGKTWGIDAEIDICNQTLESIKKAKVSKEFKARRLSYWKKRKEKLESSKSYSLATNKPDAMLDEGINEKEQQIIIDDDYLDSVSFSGYEDWRQDILDYVAAVQLFAKFKNRYSSLQSATFVANKLILEYLETDGSVDFYNFVIQKCKEMPFSVPSEKLVYDLNGSIAKKLAEDEELTTIESFIRTRLRTEEKSTRPKPEVIYPLELTGDVNIDSFAKLAKDVSHLKLRHLHIDDSEIDECVKSACKQYKKREWKSFEDYFSNAFQFGYLTERRFQRLYYILYKIAQAKLEGRSDDEIFNQLGNLYVVNTAKNKEIVENAETSKRIRGKKENGASLPYHNFTQKEHSIISVASRVTRELYYHRLYKKTASITIELINKYHKLSPEEAMLEKQFFALSIALLKTEDKKMTSVYDTIAHIANCVFDGLSENQTYTILRKENLKPFFNTGEKATNKNGKTSVRTIALNSLTASIRGCEFPANTSEYITLAEYLAKRCYTRFESAKQYYKDMLVQLNEPAIKRRTSIMTIKVMRYIIQCKINDVPDVSFRALVGSRYPSLYKRPPTNSSKNGKRKAS